LDQGNLVKEHCKSFRVAERAARSIPHPLGWGGRPQFDLVAVRSGHQEYHFRTHQEQGCIRSFSQEWLHQVFSQEWLHQVFFSGIRLHQEYCSGYCQIIGCCPCSQDPAVYLFCKIQASLILTGNGSEVGSRKNLHKCV